jgi:hypothetical protein
MAQPSESTIACNLGALSAGGRARRAELAARIRSLATEVVEIGDGYALRLGRDRELARDALDWILLESRCCPFLRLELIVEAERGPLWVRLGGAGGVKEFLETQGLATTGGRVSCGQTPNSWEER